MGDQLPPTQWTKSGGLSTSTLPCTRPGPCLAWKATGPGRTPRLCPPAPEPNSLAGSPGLLFTHKLMESFLSDPTESKKTAQPSTRSACWAGTDTKARNVRFWSRSP